MNNAETEHRFGSGGTPSGSRTRESNIELFRIITMLLIVAHHYVVNSGLTTSDGPIFMDSLSWRSLFLLFFGAWGKIGINCFVLITGFFMCKVGISSHKFFKLLFQVLFYRWIIALIFLCTGYQAFSLPQLLKILVPISDVGTGFTNAFLVFFLFIPFLSIGVNSMNEKQHLLLLVWAFFTYVFLGSIPGFSVTMNYVSWFSVLFLIASYIRLYPKKIYGNVVIWGILLCLILVLDLGSIVIGTYLGNHPYFFVMDSNAFLAVITGICAFMFFRNLKIKNSKVINTLAMSTFGVFCIHTNSESMRKWLWKDTIDCVGHYDAPLMPLYAIGCVMGVFIVCSIIDLLRIYLIEKPFFKLWDKKWEGIVAKWHKMEIYILRKIGVEDSERTEL